MRLEQDILAFIQDRDGMSQPLYRTGTRCSSLYMGLEQDVLAFIKNRNGMFQLIYRRPWLCLFFITIAVVLGQFP